MTKRQEKRAERQKQKELRAQHRRQREMHLAYKKMPERKMPKDLDELQAWLNKGWTP